MQRIQEAIESSGGSEVWIKAPVGRDAHEASAAAPQDVVAASSVFDPLLAAIKREVERQKLETGVSETRPDGRWRVVEIRLARGGEPIGRWRLREVAKLRRAAILIDDLGMDLGPARELLHLPCSLTFSVLPRLHHSTEVAEEAHGSGREVMLHLPMQPEGGTARPGPGEIQVGMSAAEAAATIERDLDSVPYAAGVNNHMGSRATADVPLMAAVMTALAQRGLYFVDSRTTAATVALEAARRQGIPAFYRSVFLDDVETVDYTLGQLGKFRRLVGEQGVALAIGHPYPTTLAALARFCPEFERDDIALVPASQLVRLPEVAKLSPPYRASPSRTD